MRTIHGVIDVVHWFTSMRTRAVGELKALPGQLLAIGEHAMEGLLHGLESAGSSVLSYIGHFVSSIPGTFMKLLGINSPSKVFHEIGLSIGEGLTNGIDASHATVLNSAGKLAKGIPMSFGHIYGSSGHHMRPGGGQSTLVVTAEGGDLVKAIVKALRYDIKANGGGNVQNYLGWGSA
jgi:phage-related protein